MEQLVRGLRTREDEKFIEYFKIVQKAAGDEGFVFFLENGEGNEIETADISGEDLFGWFIPQDMADEFEKLYMSHSLDDTWYDYFLFATWKYKDGVISIEFGIGQEPWQKVIPESR